MAERTNALRQLDRLKIPYREHDYTHTGAVSAEDVAAILGQDPARVFKTLVTTGKSGAHYVFMVPAGRELDLKKAASHVGEKSVEMLKAKDLLPLTGYIHGGCSPIGMKKLFRTVIDRSAQAQPALFFSGGRIGCQVEAALTDLQRAVPVETADIVRE